MPDAMVDSAIDAPPACAAANTFGAEQTFDLGGTGVAFAIGKLDPGAALDVAVAVTSGVVILHGDGAGNFGTPLQVDTPAIGVAIEDYDLDVRNDLILWDGATVVERLQSGASPGTFLAADPLPGSFASVKNAITELFDGAFRPDLIVQDDNGRRVFTSNFDGSFSTTTQNIGVAGDDLVTVTQVDGTNRADVTLVDQSGNVKLSLAVGSTGLSTPQTIATGATGHAAAFGQFDDGPLVDLVIATPAGGKLFTQSSPGTFVAQPGTIPGVVGSTLLVADVNGDGLDDIVAPGSITMQCSGHVFTQVESLSSVAPAQLVDVNVDGKLDLVRLVGNNLVVRLQ